MMLFSMKKFPSKSRDSKGASGGASKNTTLDHLLVIRYSDENIKIDVIEPREVREQELLKIIDPIIWHIH